MPLYEFVCQKCGAMFEEICERDAAPICPKCGSAQVARQISAPGPLLRNPFPFKPGAPAQRIGYGGNGACAACGQGGCGMN